ncbi:DUF721 domain-containing protein [Kamptonema formosum]|uniref:DUF721 domain-containing protein n=1 Tax=Kamptonema formosum TaxID=331992 RepID=UPI000344E812|nr:DUF721 domain-containing protein [Oscillatoria sp. PCC 10802]
MGFESLNRALGSLGNQAQLQPLQEFQRLRSCWPDAVGPVVAAQTRLLSVERGVLKVAVSSSVWAQQLTFQRRLILAKLNACLAAPLADIRFSTAQWVLAPQSDESVAGDHPSRLPHPHQPPAAGSAPAPPDALAAFQRWAQGIQARGQSLPLCPQCDCPAPPGEIQRWGVCALCAAQQW